MLRTAVDAHGGRQRLAGFSNVHLVSEGIFKGSAEFRRTVHYRDADNWSMEVAGAFGSLRMGVDGGRCWQQDRYRVETCSADERRELARIAIEHNAWMLLGIDEATVQPTAAPIRFGLHRFPSLRTDDVTLVFDPQTHYLSEIRRGNRTESLSDYRTIDGVVLATRRLVTIDGQVDVDESMRQLLPGGAEAKALHAPEAPRDSLVVDHTDAPRAVAWTTVQDSQANVAATVQQLDEFVRRQRRYPSHSDGLIWTMPASDDSGDGWQLAVGVEASAALAPLAEGALHLETWPAIPVLGLFHHGTFDSARQQQDRLMQLLRERGRVPAAGARVQILAPRNVIEAPATPVLWFVRVAVQ